MNSTWTTHFTRLPDTSQPTHCCPRPIYYSTPQLHSAWKPSRASDAESFQTRSCHDCNHPSTPQCSGPHLSTTPRGLAAFPGLPPHPQNSRLRASDTFSAARFSACSSCWMP